MIRKANKNDIAQIMAIFKQAVIDLKEQNIDQWQNNYPNEASILEDINEKNAYVLEENDQIYGYYYLTFDKEENYEYIEDGKWLSEEKYGTIHRIVVDSKYQNQGFAQKLFNHALATAIMNESNLRIDTHKDNIKMQKFIKKNYFVYCGIIYVSDKTPRYAYELILN